MKNLLKKLIDLSKYKIINKKSIYSLQEQITRDDFFNIYFSMVEPKEFTFVQLGANNGMHGDPLYEYVKKYNLKGLAVEPEQNSFKQLKENYKDCSVKCVDNAIGDKHMKLPFYSVKDFALENVDERRYSMLTAISSLDKTSFIRCLKKKIRKDENPDDYTKVTMLDVITFDELCENNGVNKIDFLQIDVEGLDWKILKTIDLKKYSPTIINFEMMHLSEKELNDSKKLLERHGYKWFRYYNIDMCAYKI